MMPFADFEYEVEQIDYRYLHPQILYGLIRWLQPEMVVEIGTHIGYAACWMARALQENNRGALTCIDNFCWTDHDQEAQWNANIDRCGIRDVVTLIRGRSQEVEWPARIDLAYIDGNHAYEVCRYDVLKARELGASVIVMHDTVSCRGARLVADRIRGDIEAQFDQEYFTMPDAVWEGWDIIEDNRESGLTILKRREPKGSVDANDESDKWDKVKN